MPTRLETRTKKELLELCVSRKIKVGSNSSKEDIIAKLRRTKTPSRDIVVYGIDGCPYCEKTKRLLKGIKHTYVNYNTLSQKDKERLRGKTNGYSKVPQVFVDNKFVGGSESISTAILGKNKR